MFGALGRLTVGPDDVHQMRDGHDLVAAQRQGGEDAALGRPFDNKRPSVDRLDLAQQTDLHGHLRPFRTDPDTIRRPVRKPLAAASALLNGEMSGAIGTAPPATHLIVDRERAHGDPPADADADHPHMNRLGAALAAVVAELASMPTPPPATDRANAHVTVVGADNLQRAALAEAVDRFRANHLDLPDLEVRFSDDPADCHGHDGWFRPGSNSGQSWCAGSSAS